MIDVYENYKKFDFPLDVLWSDIDYMDWWRDFTVATELTFKGLPEFVDLLHSQNIKYVPIMDAGLALVPDPTYTALKEGLDLGVFIKSGNPNRDKMDTVSPIKNLNKTLYGWVWPGYAAFPDFTNP